MASRLGAFRYIDNMSHRRAFRLLRGVDRSTPERTMSQPFDVTLKDVVRAHAANFVPAIESSAYEIINEARARAFIRGRLEQAQRMLLRIGRTRFGPAPAATE